MRNVNKYVIVILMITITYLLFNNGGIVFNEKIIGIESEIVQPFYVGEFNNNYYIGEYNDSNFSLYAFDSINNKLEIKYEPNIDLLTMWGDTSKDGVFLMEIFYNDDGGLAFQIKRMFGENVFRTVFTDNCVKIPSLCLMEDKLFINYVYKDDKNFSSVLVQYDTDNDLIEEIDKKKYIVNKDGTCKGITIVYSGGYDNTLYYQLIYMDNEMIERAEKTMLIKYSLDEKNITGKYPLINKALHISGTSEFILLSEYDYYEPLFKSGKIFQIVDDGLDIKDSFANVESGRDIINSRAINKNLILFTTADSYNIYDFNKRKHYFNVFTTNQLECSEVKISNNEFSYLEYDDNNIIIHIIEYENKEI